MTTQADQVAQGTWLGLAEASQALNVPLPTLRRKVKAGELDTRKVPMKTGFKYEVFIPELPPTHTDTHEGTHMSTQDLSDLLQGIRDQYVLIIHDQQGMIRQQAQELSRLGQELEHLSEERMQMAGQLGFYQGQLQQLQTQLQEAQQTILALQAPAEPVLQPKPWWKFW